MEGVAKSCRCSHDKRRGTSHTTQLSEGWHVATSRALRRQSLRRSIESNDIQNSGRNQHPRITLIRPKGSCQRAAGMPKRRFVRALPNLVDPKHHYAVRICSWRVAHHLSIVLHQHVVPRQHGTVELVVSDQVEACLHPCVARSVNTGSGCPLPIHRWHRAEVWRCGISRRPLRPC